MTLPYGGTAWLVSRHADVRFVLGDQRFGRADTCHPDTPRFMPEPASEGLLQSLDPPDHRRVRTSVRPAFTVRRMRYLRPRVEEIASGLIDDVVAGEEPTDLVTAFSIPLPVAVICELLGVPLPDRADVGRWAAALLSTSGSLSTEREQAHHEMLELFTGLLAERRNAPQDDVLTVLVNARDDDDRRLDDNEVITLASDLLLAGHETTSAQLTNSIFQLLCSGGLHQIGEDEQATNRAVEELLRFVPLGAGAARCRIALEDTEVAGVRVRAGDAVFAMTTSGNRDPEAFQDPADLDLARASNPHLAFGFGAHHCLGAPLARMQLQVALTLLRTRMPRLRLAVARSELSWRTDALVRAPERLPVMWS